MLSLTGGKREKGKKETETGNKDMSRIEIKCCQPQEKKRERARKKQTQKK